MLSWWRQLGWRRSADVTLLERRLGLEADEARLAPAPELRRRTLAALRDVALADDRGHARRRPVGFAYALVCGLLTVLAVAATLHVSGPSRPPAETVAAEPAGTLRLLGFRQPRLGATFEAQLPLGGRALETGLLTEARLLAADVRQARAEVLARLPRVPGS